LEGCAIDTGELPDNLIQIEGGEETLPIQHQETSNWKSHCYATLRPIVGNRDDQDQEQDGLGGGAGAGVVVLVMGGGGGGGGGGGLGGCCFRARGVFGLEGYKLR